MSSRPIALQLEHLQVSYFHHKKPIYILNNITLQLKRGEIVSLLGESGSGKSTIAKAITGLLPPSASIHKGTMTLQAAFTEELSQKNIAWDRIRGTEIALLFQDAQQALNPVITIREHFRECLLHHQVASKKEADSISIQLLEMLNFVDGKAILNLYPFQLSGGMCQRVCLALALCLKPKVLIADEPTSALDTVSQKEVLDLLMKLKEELGLSVLLITHDIAIAGAISERVIVLKEGNIVEEGPTTTVFSKPQALYTKQLLSSRAQLISQITIDAYPIKEPFLLEIKNLHKHFTEHKNALNNINLRLHSKEILGILGQSGSGKSTLAKCIAGLETVSSGQVIYRGIAINELTHRKRRKFCHDIQMIFQDARASLNPSRTALELVQEPLEYLHITSKKERAEMAGYYLNQVGISNALHNRRTPELSSGQCQRIAIARALILKPNVLICDEAVSALDMSVQTQIILLLKKLQKQYGFSVIMISHDIRVLQSFCHNIVVMNNGRFNEEKQPSSTLHESKQFYTQQLVKCSGEMERHLHFGKG